MAPGAQSPMSWVNPLIPILSSDRRMLLAVYYNYLQQ